jgi:hypothetical protein
MIDDVLVFRSTCFSLDAPVENDVQYDVPLGDDFATLLKSQLGSKRARWEVLDPVREDFGSVILLRDKKKTFVITITWAPIFDREDYWAVQFHQSHGCLGLILRPKDDLESVREIKECVNSIIASDDNTFRDARWISDGEFRRLV